MAANSRSNPDFYDYPNLRVTMRCNLNNDGGEFIGSYGTKGTMIIKDSTLTYTPQDTATTARGLFGQGLAEEGAGRISGKVGCEHPEPKALEVKIEEQAETFAPPHGYNDTADHQANFFNAVRSRKPTVENEIREQCGPLDATGHYAYFNKNYCRLGQWREENREGLERFAAEDPDQLDDQNYYHHQLEHEGSAC